MPTSGKYVRILLDSIPGMSFLKSAKTGVYLACNQAFANYARKPHPKDVVGLTDAQIFDAETARHFVEDDRKALAMNEPHIFFEDVPDAAGTPMHLQTTKTRYADADGEVYCIGLCRDVTESVRLQKENAFVKAAYEKAKADGIMFSRIAKTLAGDYIDLYHVNLRTGSYVEYLTEDASGELTEVQRGADFFASGIQEIALAAAPEDREMLLKGLSRSAIAEALSHKHSFLLTYLMQKGERPLYVSMKVSRMMDDDESIIISLSDVDEQVRKQKLIDQLAQERLAYSRFNALNGDLVCMYVVEPQSGRYWEYSSARGTDLLGMPARGEDFFAAVQQCCHLAVHPGDLERFRAALTRESVLQEIERQGLFVHTYRIVLKDGPLHVKVRAAKVLESDGERLIFGLVNIESLVQKKNEYERRLAQAQESAHIDALTHVKNKHAYLETETVFDKRIQEHRQSEFALAILDVNDLKQINDTAGHQAGDQHLCTACGIICKFFKCSPVYRFGGDEFAILIEGDDYERLDELCKAMDKRNEVANLTGGIVIAYGIAKYGNESCVAELFKRADELMYKSKRELKARKQQIRESARSSAGD